jgi:ABC-2 type transport system permease protein
MALLVAGELIDSERWSGTLEALVATPASFPLIITGRIAAVTVVSLLAFVESWLVAWALFGITVAVLHPVVFAAAIGVTAFAMAGTASMMSAVFVLARSARIFQNTLSYPFYVLGGVLVPVSLLPGWLEPLSRVVFLSWSADLLRDSLTSGTVPDVALRLTAVLGLGAAGLLAGVLLLRRVLTRVRTLGTLTYA